MPPYQTFSEAIVRAYGMNPVGTHGTVAVGTAGTTVAVPCGAFQMMFQALGTAIRYSIAGTAGTITGFQLAAGAVPVTVTLGPASAVSFAAEAGTATLNYQFVA